MIPLAMVFGWFVSRLRSTRRRTTVASVAVGVASIAVLFTGSVGTALENLFSTALLIGAIVALTGLGLGSVLGWPRDWQPRTWRPALADVGIREADTGRLADTPFAVMPEPQWVEPPRRGERINVVFVVMASQSPRLPRSPSSPRPSSSSWDCWYRAPRCRRRGP